MTRSTQGQRQGDLTISQGPVRDGAALVFSAGVSPQQVTARVSDCNGHVADVPQTKIRGPGKHRIGGQGDAWMIRIDVKDYPALRLDKRCRQWTVAVVGVWPHSRTWEARGAVAVP